MELFEWVLVLLVGAVLLSALARRIKVPYPALLALAGAGLALTEAGPAIRLDPSLALALFVAPVLLDAAYDVSIRDLRVYWLPVTSLVVVAVGLTTAAVALVAKLLVPDLPWAAAIALGAVVAPPDAVAATTVLGSVRPGRRVVMILEGESLLNDASALLIYRLAVDAVAGAGAFSLGRLAPTLLLTTIGSVAAGVAVAYAYQALDRRLCDRPSSIVLQFVTTFGAWIAAERAGMSPILAVVAFGVAVARTAPASQPARLRVPSYAVWETAVLVLNALAFVLVGLQLGPLIAAASPAELRDWFAFAGAVLATVIVVRLAWVMAANTAIRAKNARWPGRRSPITTPPTWQDGVAVGWCGMRGIVTLGTALALPDGFPHRDELLFAAFAVVLGTLVIQGTTLRPLLARLSLKDDGILDREVRNARGALAEAALEALRDEEGPEAEGLRRDFRHEGRTAAEAEEGDGRAELRGRALRRLAIRHRRERLLRPRAERAIGDDAFHRLEEELDYAELAAEPPPG